MGHVPDFEAEISWTPVDYVAKAIVRLSSQKTSLGGNFNLQNSDYMEFKAIAEYIKSRGYSLKTVDFETWLSKLSEYCEKRSDNALHPLLPLLRRKKGGRFYFYDRYGVRKNITRFDCANVNKALKSKQINCPPSDVKLLDIYFDYWMECGFLKRAET